MSRQFNEQMENRFDLYGTEYKLVEPKNLNEAVVNTFLEKSYS